MFKTLILDLGGTISQILDQNYCILQQFVL